MTGSHHARGLQQQIAEALAENGDVVVFAAGRPEYVWLEVWPEYVAARAGGGDADLSGLGWRAPRPGESEWLQYLQARGVRARRRLARFALNALTAGAGIDRGLDLVAQTRPPEQSAEPLFAVPAAPDADRGLLQAVHTALASAPFDVSAYPGHLELTAHRKRGRRTDLGVIGRSGTVTAFALHLIDPDEETVEAHLAANRSLDDVPYIYGVRPLCRHRRALVLESKVAVPVHPTAGPMVGLALPGLIEPLVNWHQAIHPATA